MPTVRPESPADVDAIERVVAAAFGRMAEAHLVAELRRAGVLALSLVAESEGEVVGHIAFSPALVDGGTVPAPAVLALGPLAVVPAQQGRGWGGLLVRHGLRHSALVARGVVVLGHPTYYPRFGFVPASRFGLHSSYDVPDEVFMALALRPRWLNGVTGQVRYHEAFSRV